MFRALSSAQLVSLDEEEHELPHLIARPRVLGSGAEYFDLEGRPQTPVVQGIHKVFSGSFLDLAEHELASPSRATPTLTDPTATSPDNFPSLMQMDHHGKVVESSTSRIEPISSAAAFRSPHTVKRFAGKVSAEHGGTVTLINACSFLGAHITMQLLSKGYNVRCVVSSLPNAATRLDDLIASVSPVMHQRRDQHRSRSILTQMEASFFQAEELRSVMSGSDYVIHCGLPPFSHLSDKDHAFINKAGRMEAHLSAIRALFEALRLESPNDDHSVQRVILTSAHGAVFDTTDPIPTSGLFDESCWHRETSETSPSSSDIRVAFEQEAWRLHKMLRGAVGLVVIIPAMMLGPSFLEEVSEATIILRDMVRYGASHPQVRYNLTDVRDVAQAHLHALSAPGVDGHRFIVSSDCLSPLILARMVRRSFLHLEPSLQEASKLTTLLAVPFLGRHIGLWRMWSMLMGPAQILDGRKAEQKLQLEMIPLEETVVDTLTDLMERGQLPRASETPKDQNQTSRWGHSHLGFGLSSAILVALMAMTGVMVMSRKRR